MRIADLRAVPISFPVPADKSVRLGIGRSVKRDSVLVRVETDEGHVGWGEAHHGRCPGAIARLVDTTMRELVLGFDAHDVCGVWARVYKMQLASHGMGAAAALALSGIDMALWDIRCQASGLPLYKMLGGAAKPIKAYAGGIALGWQDPAALVEEARRYVAEGYRALKLRMGDTPVRDIARVRAVRQAVGDEIDILTDANTAYTLDDARRVMPAFEECAVGWLEEPFPPQDRRAYAIAAGLGRVPLAAGENHYTRFEFAQLLEAGAVQVWQPDLSKCGGITEGLRIAAIASAWRIPIHPHSSATGLNHAATLHFMAATENAGYFEACVSRFNPFRDLFGSTFAIGADGCVEPPQGHGLGVEVDEALFAQYPSIDGPGYVVKF